MEKMNLIFRSLEVIESRISEKLSVENIASDVYLSRNHYQRLFRKIVGGSVMDYITKRKLTLAGRALLETDATILDVALDYGYDSREGFTRSFKAYMGVSPTEYRKYGLSTISQRVMTEKERKTMLYSKTTNEIIRELNDFVVKAKDTAEITRKEGALSSLSQPFNKNFWDSMADWADNLSQRIKVMLERINDINECPDEITNRFNILKTIDDTAFALNMIGLQAAVMAARSEPDEQSTLKTFSERYRDLAMVLVQKLPLLKKFFSDLAELILDDMHKNAVDKMDTAVRRAKVAADMIQGYDYLKNEISHMADDLAAESVGEIAIHKLSDHLFELSVLQFSIDAEIIRSGGKDMAMFNGILSLRQSLDEALSFMQTLPAPEKEEPSDNIAIKVLDDITFQLNILLLYVLGESERLYPSTNNEQKAALNGIDKKVKSFKQIANQSMDKKSFKDIAEIVHEIVIDITSIADSLNNRGGVFRFLCNEVASLHHHMLKWIKEAEAQGN